MFVLASSSTANNAKSFSVLSCDSKINLHSSEKGPLAGINIDIHHLQEISKQVKKKIVILKSSYAQGKLLSRKEILNALENKFPWHTDCGGIDNMMYGKFYFTGHGAHNGDLIIETKQHPTGYRLQIEQVIQAISKEAKGFYFVLDIYLDCCYSGMNVYRILKTFEELSISCIIVITSCGANYTSLDIYRFGGLLITRQWLDKVKPVYVSEKQINELKKLYNERKPLCFSSSNYYPPYILKNQLISSSIW